MNCRNRLFASVLAFAGTLLCTAPAPFAHAQSAPSGFGPPPAVPQITQPINPALRKMLSGNTNTRITSGRSLGALGDSEVLDNLLLSLKRSPEREAALEQFIDAQHDPSSPYFHQWLTPAEVGELYGPAPSDIDTVVSWLRDNGFTVNDVAPSGMTVDFTGTAGRVRAAFQTTIGRYSVNGVTFVSNAGDPSIPQALAPVVNGIVSLNSSFKRTNMSRPPAPPLLTAGRQLPTLGHPGMSGRSPQFAPYVPNFTFTDPTNGPYQAVAPGDFNIIYDVNPVWSAGHRGSGQTVYVLERTKINAADWTTFRTSFGLSGYAGTFTQTVPSGCTNPGQLNTGDQGEAALDAEWAGAVAPDANIVLFACKSTITSDGIDLAVNKAVNLATPPKIASLSYGSCEANMGATELSQYNSWWQQAASEGMTVFVSTGDQGSAVCDQGLSYATQGIAVNGLASTPYNVAAGGTDFRDYVDGTVSTYWNTTDNTSAPFISAKSYVPETTWNSSCAGKLLLDYLNANGSSYADQVAFCNTGQALQVAGASGGPSSTYSMPSWQSAVYGASGAKRGLPDVSLFASSGWWGHGVMYCMSVTTAGGTACDYTTEADAIANMAGGTSFVAPMLASVQALVNQVSGQSWGNMNTKFYSLAVAEYGSPGSPNSANLTNCNANLGNAIGTSCIFHDVTSGDISVPCSKGSTNCYSNVSTGTKNCGSSYCGVISTSTSSLSPAYSAVSGWDFATGLGSLDVANLIAAVTTYTIGGSVSGLTGANTVGLTLTDTTTSGTQVQSFGNGSFTFSIGLNAGDNWNVAVTTQPVGQTCSVTNGSGTNLSANVTNVTVTCTTNTYTLTYNTDGNGTISGTTPQTVSYGGSGTAVTAVPNAGYHFAQWSDASVANPRTDTNVQANVTVTAQFAANVLVFTTQPSNVTQGGTLGTIAVTEQDGSGNTVSDTATVDFTTNTACGALDLGSVAMVNGVATLNSAQSFYTLASNLTITATVTNPNPTPMAAAPSNAFNVTANADFVFSDGFESCRP